jgi:hypothetical protein
VLKDPQTDFTFTFYCGLSYELVIRLKITKKEIK